MGMLCHYEAHIILLSSSPPVGEAAVAIQVPPLVTRYHGVSCHGVSQSAGV